MCTPGANRVTDPYSNPCCGNEIQRIEGRRTLLSGRRLCRKGTSAINCTGLNHSRETRVRGPLPTASSSRNHSSGSVTTCG